MICSLICYYCGKYNLINLAFFTMNSLIPQNELDYAYYVAKNRCIFYRIILKMEDYISFSKIKKFYKEIENNGRL